MADLVEQVAPVVDHVDQPVVLHGVQRDLVRLQQLRGTVHDGLEHGLRVGHGRVDGLHHGSRGLLALQHLTRRDQVGGRLFQPGFTLGHCLGPGVLQLAQTQVDEADAQAAEDHQVVGRVGRCDFQHGPEVSGYDEPLRDQRRRHHDGGRPGPVPEAAASVLERGHHGRQEPEGQHAPGGGKTAQGDMHHQHRHLQHGAVDTEEHLKPSEPQVDQQGQRRQGARQERECGEVDAAFKHRRTQQALLFRAEHRLPGVHRRGVVIEVTQQRRGEHGVGVPDEHARDQESHDDAPALAQFGVISSFAGKVGKALRQGCQDLHFKLLVPATRWRCGGQPAAAWSRSSTGMTAPCAAAIPRRTSTARSSTSPSTKNSPVLKIARRWLPALSRVMRP